MNSFLFLICLAAISEKHASGHLLDAEFWEDPQWRGASIRYTYDDECVNLNPEWVMRASSVSTRGRCITLYSKLGCTGDSQDIYHTHRGHEFLGEINFDHKTASFKKCEPNVRIRMDERPNFYLTVFEDPHFSGASEVFGVRSGECRTLPNEWQNRISSIATNEQLYVMFDGADCSGRKEYMTGGRGGDYSLIGDLRTRNFSDVIKSFKIADLIFLPPCQDKSCPKFLYKGSAEYNFWSYFFSIYSGARRSEFEERVNRSTDGFISWDFLFASDNTTTNVTAGSAGSHHQDALENTRAIIRALRESLPGRWGFNEENMETLLTLLVLVDTERQEQRSKFKENWQDSNFAVMIQLLNTWSTMVWELSTVFRNWKPEKYDHAVQLPDVEFWKDPQWRGASIKYTYDEECVNLRSDWVKRPSSAGTRDKCITLYSELDCEGDSVDLHAIHRGHEFLGEINFDHKTSSFKKCEPDVKIQLGMRPNFYLTVFDEQHFAGDSEVFGVTSGECRTLPEEWQNRISSIVTNEQLYVVFEGDNCSGRRKYVTGGFGGDYSLINDLGTRNFNDVIKSFKIANLTFQPPCADNSCPKFLSKGSAEYNFWQYFFSISFLAHLSEFEERVNRSTDGFISWDFLFTSNMSAGSAESPHQDAIESTRVIIRALRESRPGRWGFNPENLETLLPLVRNVHKEREEQKSKFQENWNDANFAVIAQLTHSWSVMAWELSMVLQNWKSSDNIGHAAQLPDAEFWEGPQWRGASIKYTYDSKCVNLRSDWVKRPSSVGTRGKCITLYSKLDCKGDSVDVHHIHRGHEFLGEINFDHKTSSFKKCDPDVKIQLGMRPNFYLTVFDEQHFAGASEVFGVTTGECRTLPKEWQNRISSIVTNEQLYVVFDGINCSGEKKYLTGGFGGDYSSINDLGRRNFNDVIKSFKIADLTFQPPCAGISCPKFLSKGSVEYNFWLYFFSIFSRAHRSEFEERVKRSTNGFISWNFLFTSNKAAGSAESPHQDAIESTRVIIRALRESHPGRWGFNAENLETLLALVQHVQNERQDQKSKFKENWNDGNYAVMVQLAHSWSTMVWELSVVLQNWKPNDNIGDDICGKIEEDPSTHLPGETLSLISSGAVANYGDDPWHVALFTKLSKRSEPILICGGTLISRSVVVSAAHCFYNSGLKKVLNNPGSYEVYVGKFTRNYETKDSSSQKIHSIQELIFNPKTYNPAKTGTHGSDIVLIVLQEEITVDRYVRPVCLDWDNSIFGSLLDPKTKGRIVGWGSTSTNNDASDLSDYLLTAEIPYISHEDCVGEVQHLTIDNFCGGEKSGSGARRGDSGGGFVFKYKNRHYLRGIVSTRDKHSNSSISAFTDVNSYIPWIRRYV